MSLTTYILEVICCFSCSNSYSYLLDICWMHRQSAPEMNDKGMLVWQGTFARKAFSFSQQ